MDPVVLLLDSGRWGVCCTECGLADRRMLVVVGRRRVGLEADCGVVHRKGEGERIVI